jgi:cysteine desulfurase / selenocysteine lyase
VLGLAMSVTPLFDPAAFRLMPGVAHVCAGGETACLKRHDAALLQYLADKSAGMPGRVAQEARVARARAGIARMWGVSAEEIGFVGNVAEGVAILTESLDWREGDNICIDANEYPSVVAPFALHRHPPVALRITQGGEPDRLAACVDSRTRVIGVSHVSYLTGERFDLAALRRLADSVGALLVVDFTQAAGYLPIDASVADFAFSACYKWVLGITGAAVAYWNRTRQPDWMPASAGWHSLAPGDRGYDKPPALREDALRFTRGNLAHAAIYALAEALDFLSGYDMRDVQRHVQSLTVALLDGLVSLRIPIMTPADPTRHGASVCVASPHAQAIVDALQARGVLAWNGHGRVRFSFHGYNSQADVAHVLEAMRAVWPG